MKKISFFMQLIFLTMAYFAFCKAHPNIAYAGWESVSFVIFAVLMFVIPIFRIGGACHGNARRRRPVRGSAAPFPPRFGFLPHGSCGFRCVLAW